jgi:HD-GYP domain-containing protein (c-di-GMP phosphodiesterase class II)
VIALRRSRGTLTAVRDETASVLLRILDEREDDLNRHLRHVAGLVHEVAAEVGLIGDRLEILTRAAECHDIGKVAIPDDVLQKPGPLDEGEWHLMRQHTVIGERILAAAPSMVPVARVVRSCHERWDGLGYPDGLPGPQIPLESRLIFICDAFDAMVAGRPYREALEPERALDELCRQSGTQFDPELTEVVCETLGAAAPEPRTGPGRPKLVPATSG